MNSIYKRNIKVRFHLGAGKNYKHWRFQIGSLVNFIEPSGTKIILKNCKLINQKNSSLKIFKGKHKTVCAWIMCESVTFVNKIEFKNELTFNPRVLPNWISDNKNMDESIIDEIHVNENRLFIK